VAFFARKAHHVQVLDLNSREVITVTPREELSVRHLGWSPDTKLLAYEVETRGRIKVYSIAERKEVLIKEQGADLFIPASMFFLDAERLAVQPHQTVIEGQPKDFTECGPSGIVKAPVVALRISTGEVERPFPEEFYGAIRPIAGGRKFLGIADDDRDWFSAAGAVIPPPGVSPPGVAEGAAPSLIEGVMWAAAALFARPPKIAIFDCDSGNKSVVKPPHRNREMITRVDNAKGCFQTTVFGNGKLEVRTISLTGEITENRECPIDVPWMDPRESAWSESGDALLYRDFRTLKLWSFTQNREETILSDMELIISHISWLSPTEALMAISKDSSEAATWSNTIAKVHLDTKQLEELYRGVSLFHMRCALSPGHRYFAFVDEVSKEMYWDELRMLDLQTKQLTTLVSAKEGAFLQDVCWSPDGSSIVYAYGMRTGYAPGRSPEDQEKLKKEMETGKLDPDEAMKLLQAMSGPMYEVEDSINLMSLADKQPVKLLVLPKDAACHEIQFSGPDRIAYRLGSHVGDGAGHGTSINVFNLKSRQQERRIETKSKGRMWATADGRRILLEGVMD
jgi:hypothetical protein